MKLKNFIPGLIILFISITSSAYAQQDTMSLKTIVNKTMKLSYEHPIEKVYLHTDKPYYAVGDTIWFKAYLTIGPHQLSDLSKIIYVDIIGPHDSLVQNLRLPVFNSFAYGTVPLPPANYKQGNYRIRAYTNWMRNFDDAYFFNKTFTLGNVADKQVVTHASITCSPKNNPLKTTVHILFKDADGSPLVNKKVNWTIVTDPEADKPLKGKEVTDANGYFNLSLLNSKLPDVKVSSLATEIEYANKKIAISYFPLRAALPLNDVQFFPEGGDLITGMRSKVGFKAVKPDGLGIDIKGIITDNEGKTITDFSSQNIGMGAFFIVPEAGKTYQANVTFPDGTSHVYDLPRVLSEGINLSVANTDPDKITVKFFASDAYFQKNQNKQFYLLAQNGGIIYFAAQTVLAGQVYAANIAKNKFPTGILQLTLFDDRGRPLTERLVFIRQPDLLKIDVNSGGKTSFGPRQKVKLNINAKAKNLPVDANLSVSVVDETKVPFDENSATTILTSILLSSDLKGYIEKPNYYFKQITEKTDADLDILMLTQGYRRFLYRDILADKYPQVYFLPEQGIEITGTLRNKTGMPINKGSVRLQIPDKNYSTQTTTDPSGNFKFSKIALLDSSQVILNARNNVNASYLMMTVNPATMPGISHNYNLPDEVLNIDSSMNSYLLNSKKIFSNSHVLKEVLIKSTPTIKKVTHADYSALTGLSMEADHMIDGERLKDCPNFASCLQTLVLGLTYESDNYYVTRDYNSGKKTPVQIYLGGMPVDYAALNSVNSAEVESVEIFNNDGFSGINRMSNTNGVLVINMKKPPVGTKITQQQLAELFPPSYILKFTPKGYNMAREFYSPKYVAPPSVLQRADLRSTIYWNPKVVTDKTTGAASVEFFNADSRGTYKAIVEGIDADGNIGRFVYRYKIE